MGAFENTCRTCGKTSELEDGSDLYPMYTSTDYYNELKMVLEEFKIWNLKIFQDDGLPQKICLTCFDSFCQIHNFRLVCQEAQMNFGELCTGLDIIIKSDPEFGDIDVDFPEDFKGKQTIIVREHYQFPDDERSEETEKRTCDKLLEKMSDDEGRRQRDREDEAFEELNASMPEFKRFQCAFCMDVIGFDDVDLLNKHYNAHHFSDKPYPCPKCEKSFNTKGKRNSHARVHYRTIVECEVCGKKVRGGKRMMAQHNELHHIRKERECHTCGKKFESITLKRFNYHMSWHDETKLHKCKYCDRKFIQTTHLIVHERTHTGESPYLCSKCGMGFKDSGALNSHMAIHGTKELQCPHCPKKFYLKPGLKLHMQIHDPNREEVRCEICERPFRTAMSLLVHNYKIHNGPESPDVLSFLQKREKKNSFIKPHKCEKCPQSFVLHTQLLKHLKTHEENRPYSCDQCGKSFKRDAHLRLHVNTLHLNKKPHKCSICGWAFSQRRNLKEHFDAKHEAKKDYKCDVCGKEFAVAKSLRTHKLTHSDTKSFICTICNKGFKQLGMLKLHMNNHLKRNEADIAGGDITDIAV